MEAPAAAEYAVLPVGVEIINPKKMYNTLGLFLRQVFAVSLWGIQNFVLKKTSVSFGVYEVTLTCEAFNW